MKVRRQLEALESFILDPVKDLPDDHWHVSPTDSWTIGQIVDHLATSLDVVAKSFEGRRDKEMARRASPKQALLRHLVLQTGKLSKGRKTPPQAAPADRPEPELICAEFRMGTERMLRMSEEWPDQRRENVFVAHPVFGDLNLPEWARFHFVHCRHHSHQIAIRKRWLAAR